MPIQSLPCEIVMSIIERLPWKGDLLSISLTSTYFLALARPILFSNIILPVVTVRGSRLYRISRSPHPRDYNEFISFLTSAPYLASLIRNLMLLENRDENCFLNHVSLEPLSPELLHRILSRLPSLRSLRLYGVTCTTHHTSGSYRYPNIDHLTISSASRPWDLKTPLASFSHIRKLTLSFQRDKYGSRQIFKEILKGDNISNIFPEDLQVFDLCLEGEYWASELWTDMARQTPTPKILQSLSIHCDTFSHECRPSSAMFDLMREAAPTLKHLTLGTGSMGAVQPGRCPFDSQEMCSRLAPLTSLRSLTLKFTLSIYEQAEILNSMFARMVPILASFPPCLRHITLSFANTRRVVPPSSSRVSRLPEFYSSWRVRWTDVDLRLLVPLIRRYQELETITFKGVAEDHRKECILAVDLLEFRRLIRFVD